MASNPLIQKIIDLTLQADGEASETSFEADVVEIEVQREPGSIVSVTTLDGETHSDVGPDTWSLRMVIVQDWDASRPGLAKYLADHAGDSCVFAYNAHAAGWGANTPGYTGTISALIAPSYGGEGNEFITRELVMPLAAAPTLATADPNA